MFDGLISLMEKFDDEDDEKVTIFDTKQNLITYSVIELTTKKYSMNNSLDSLNEEKRVIVV